MKRQQSHWPTQTPFPNHPPQSLSSIAQSQNPACRWLCIHKWNISYSFCIDDHIFPDPLYFPPPIHDEVPKHTPKAPSTIEHQKHLISQTGCTESRRSDPTLASNRALNAQSIHHEKATNLSPFLPKAPNQIQPPRSKEPKRSFRTTSQKRNNQTHTRIGSRPMISPTQAQDLLRARSRLRQSSINHLLPIHNQNPPPHPSKPQCSHPKYSISSSSSRSPQQQQAPSPPSSSPPSPKTSPPHPPPTQPASPNSTLQDSHSTPQPSTTATPPCSSSSRQNPTPISPIRGAKTRPPMLILYCRL